MLILIYYYNINKHDRAFGGSLLFMNKRQALLPVIGKVKLRSTKTPRSYFLMLIKLHLSEFYNVVAKRRLLLSTNDTFSSSSIANNDYWLLIIPKNVHISSLEMSLLVFWSRLIWRNERKWIAFEMEGESGGWHNYLLVIYYCWYASPAWLVYAVDELPLGCRGCRRHRRLVFYQLLFCCRLSLVVPGINRAHITNAGRNQCGLRSASGVQRADCLTRSFIDR